MTKPIRPIRKRIDPATETRVLFKSLRKCCLCFHLKGDFNEKLGQIAHLDKNPANGSEDNLVFLCLEHHTLYDSKTSQHKNYTSGEVRIALAKLHGWITIRRSANEEHRRLNMELQNIRQRKHELDRAWRIQFDAQDWDEIAENEKQQNLLWNRMVEIFERQFSIELELSRL